MNSVFLFTESFHKQGSISQNKVVVVVVGNNCFATLKYNQ